MTAAIDFLKLLYPDGVWLLTSIALDRRSIDTKCFGPSTETQCEAWIAQYEGKRNIYFAVNNPIDPNARKKASKEQVKEVAYFHVDIDYRAGEDLGAEKARILSLLTDRLPRGVPEPTAVWQSGGGAWAIWKLRTPVPVNGDVPTAESLEEFNRWLELQFDADACHDISRIARLPGTTNLPNQQKISKGRVPALAELVFFHPDRVYELEAFQKAADVGSDLQGEVGSDGGRKAKGKGKKGSGPGEAPRKRAGAGELEDEGDGGDRKDVAEIPADAEVHRLNDITDLDAYPGIPDRVRVAIVQGSDPENVKDEDNSRSAWLFDVTCALMRAEVPDEVIYGIITDPRFLIAESVLALGRNARKYALKQLKSAHHATWDFNKDEKGRVRSTQYNIGKALTRLGITVAWNEFAGRHEVEGLPGFGPALCDAALTRMRLLLEKRYRFLPQKEYFYEVVTDVGRYNSHHPVREYLRGLTWDGVGRIDTWLIEYAGAEDSEYTRAVSRLFLMAAAKRPFYPGCKFDEMLVLESGEQGIGKSTALAELCPEEEWFSDDLPLDADGKRVIEQTRGRWIVECAELKGMKTRDVEHMKSLLARRSDTARMAYGKIPEQVPRQCVFAGTTNESHYLVDPTGNRRFWPVTVGHFNVEAIRLSRDQLWAEAYARVDRGEKIRMDPAVYDAAHNQQIERVQEDPWSVTIERLFHGIIDAHITYEDVWTLLGVEIGMRKGTEGARIRLEMTKLGWKKVKIRLDSVPIWCWQIGEGARLLKASEMNNPRDEGGAPISDPF